MNHVIDPVFWRELKGIALSITKTGVDVYYIFGFCYICDKFIPVWETEKKFIQRHAKNFLKQNPQWNEWHISDILLFRVLGFRLIQIGDLKIRAEFCQYMEEHCTEDPYTKWERFVINIKTWLKWKF